jgi:hypothetical protein
MLYIIQVAKERFKVPFKIVEGSAENNIREMQAALEAL